MTSDSIPDTPEHSNGARIRAERSNLRHERSALRAEHLSAGYGDWAVLEALSLDIRPGEVTALVGPNGSGKSTLLKTLARLLRPRAGAVYLDGKAIAQLSTTEVARRLAMLPQSPDTPGALTVRELVEQGRYPHSGPLRMLRQQDHAAIHRALTRTRTLAFADRSLDSLSGGERQRAWIALTLAQDTSILLLDEPTTFLDIRHQLEVLELVECLNREQALTIVMVLHDLNQAARYADRLVVLDAGHIVADGDPTRVLTAGLLRDVFKVAAHIGRDPHSGAPVCMPYAALDDPPPGGPLPGDGDPGSTHPNASPAGDQVAAAPDTPSTSIPPEQDLTT